MCGSGANCIGSDEPYVVPPVDLDILSLEPMEDINAPVTIFTSNLESFDIRLFNSVDLQLGITCLNFVK